MNWHKIPLFLFLLIIVSITGVLFVLATNHIPSASLSDTASIADSIATLITASLSAPFTDTASFTDSITALLGILSTASDTASIADSITALITGSLLPATAEALSFTDNVVAGFTSISVPSPTGGGSIPITAGNGSLTNISATTPPSSPPLPPNAVAVNFPHGVISFTANTTSGGMVILTIQYPSLPSLSNNQYYTYYKLVNNSWVQVSSNPANPDGYFELSGNTVTLHIKDNGAYDNDNTPGIVSDLGGIAVVTLRPPSGGGGGGGAPVIIQPLKTTVDTKIAVNVANIQVDKDILIQGVITDNNGNKLNINGVALITIEGKGRLVKQVEIINGEYTLAVKPSEFAKSVKSRDVNISISFNDLELREGNRITEYKASDVKIDVKVTGSTINEKVREGKRAIMTLLENITDSKISKITLHAEDDGKIIAVSAKDFSRKRLSMHDIELNIKEGKVKSFGDIIKFAVVKEGKITYKVYDETGKVIKEGAI